MALKSTSVSYVGSFAFGIGVLWMRRCSHSLGLGGAVSHNAVMQCNVCEVKIVLLELYAKYVHVHMICSMHCMQRCLSG